MFIPWKKVERPVYFQAVETYPSASLGTPEPAIRACEARMTHGTWGINSYAGAERQLENMASELARLKDLERRLKGK